MMNIIKLMARVDAAVEEMCRFFKESHDFMKTIYTEWTAKDVLAHITMWHEDLAQNISRLMHNNSPVLLKGTLSEINESGVDHYRQKTINELIELFTKANVIIGKYIRSKGRIEIPYRNGSKTLTTANHLQRLSQHIEKHLWAIKSKYNE